MSDEVSQVIVNRNIQCFGKTLHHVLSLPGAHQNRFRIGHLRCLNITDIVPYQRCLGEINFELRSNLKQ